MKKYESEIIQMCHEEMMGLHKIGAISDARMKEFDDMCLAPDFLRKSSPQSVRHGNHKAATFQA